MTTLTQEYATKLLGDRNDDVDFDPADTEIEIESQEETFMGDPSHPSTYLHISNITANKQYYSISIHGGINIVDFYEEAMQWATTITVATK